MILSEFLLMFDTLDIFLKIEKEFLKRLINIGKNLKNMFQMKVGCGTPSIPFSINGLKVCTYNEFNIVATEFHFGLDLV